MDQVEHARELIMEMAPPAMREQFGPLVELALAQMPAESVSKLVSDLESAHNEDGSIDVDRLITVGKGFGLTDEAISSYQASYQAMNEANP